METIKTCPKCEHVLPEDKPQGTQPKQDYICPHCGVNIVQYNLKKHVGVQDLAEFNFRCWLREHSEHSNTPIWLALLGCLCMAVGVFLPVLHFSMLESVNYYQRGSGHGVYLLILAVASLVLIAMRHLLLLWVTSVLSAGLLIYSLLSLANFFSDVQSRLQKIKGSLSDFTMDSITLAYSGWIVMWLGVILLFVAAALETWRHYHAARGAGKIPKLASHQLID